ncbi:PLT6 [Symbiodinium sp. CCMP2592]|nr:PLT6 [Symbiodinium sp. CCMP2592]
MERRQSAAARRLLCYGRLWGLMKFLETGLFQLVFDQTSRGTFSFSKAPLCKLCAALGLSFWLFSAAAPAAPPSEPLLGRAGKEASEASKSILLPLLLLSQVLGVLVVLESAPLAWDYQYASALMELSLAAILALGILLGRHYTFDARCAFVLNAARPMLCGQLGLLYLFAGVWKLNSTFLDLQVSCAPVLWAQLLAKYFYWLDYFGEVNVVLVKISIFGTLLVEIGLAVLVLVFTIALSLPRMQVLTAWLPVTTRLIFAVGLSLHLLIAICPSPNGAGGFSCAMAVCYVWLLPLPLRNSDDRVPVPSSSISSRIIAAAFMLVPLLALLALGLDMQDFAMPVYGVMVAILYTECRHGDDTRSIHAGYDSYDERGTRVTLMTQLFFLLLFLAWSLGSAFLGIQDMGADTMYGGLQVYGAGRGNHIFLPTGMFWEAQHQLESGARPLLYRVSSVSQSNAGSKSTSSALQYLRSLYPAEVQLQPPAAEVLLRSVGHTARMFSPGAARVLGPNWAEEAALLPFRLQPYVVPEVELCRMVWEARAIMKRTAEEPEPEPGSMNTSAPPLEIHVSPLDQGQSKMLILVTAGSVEVKCARFTSPEHVRGRLQEVLQKPMPYWVWKMLVYFPIPSSLTFAGGATLQPAGCVA